MWDYGLVEEEAAHRIDDLRYRLAVGERLEPPWHAVGLHEALEARVSGNNQIKPANWTASTLRIRSAMVVPIHENAKLKSKSYPRASAQSTGPASG